MTRHTLSVPDISCDHCKTSIEGAVAPLAGVERVEVRIADQEVDLSYDPGMVDLNAIVEAIEEQGYQVTGRS